MTTEVLEQAIATTRGVLANVSRDQLDDATPCASWKVRDLINHIVGGQYFFAGGVRGELPSGDTDWAAGDFLADFDTGARQCVDAFNSDGAMDKMLTLPFGQMPGSAFIGLASTDTFTHGWDLARATGQEVDWDPGLLEVVHREIAATAEMGRAMGIYGPPVPVDGSEPVLARALGLTGRDPHWMACH